MPSRISVGQAPPLTPSATRRRGSGGRSLVAACIAMLLGPGPLVYLAFGVYLLPIVEDTGWDRATVASSIGAPLIIAGLMAPVVGWLTNRFGPRRFLMFGIPLSGVSIMLLSTPDSASMFLVMMTLAGVLTSGQTLVPFVYCISGWFEERRGMALGLMLACTGLGLAIAPPLAAHLIELLGWRQTYLTFGVIVIAMSIPVAHWLIADPPVVAATDRALIPGMPLRAALTTRVFWLLMVSISLLGAASTAGVVNLNVLLVERGVSASRASFVMTLVGTSMIVARLVFGYLFDRVRAQWLTAFVGSIAAAAFLVLATVTGPTGVLIAAVLIGISFGAEGDALSYMTSRAFGMRDFGTIFGIMFMSFSVGGSFGPPAFALLKSHSGNYQSALWFAAFTCALTSLLVLLIRDGDLPFARRQRGAAVTADVVLPGKA